MRCFSRRPNSSLIMMMGSLIWDQAQPQVSCTLKQNLLHAFCCHLLLLVICDLLSALDTDVVVPDRPSHPLFPRRLPLSLKVHPDIVEIAPEALQQMRVLHLKHLDALIEHEVMWSFAFGSIYFPLYFLTQYIVETNPNTLMLGTCEANPLGILPTHLHDVCWSKSTCDSKQLCRETWDYVIGKGHKLKEKFKKVALDLWPKHMVVNPSTSIPI